MENTEQIYSINQFCKLMGISRSRYYQLIYGGLIFPPTHSSENKRPYYSQTTLDENLNVKKMNIGVNGKVCLFYNSRTPKNAVQPKTKIVKQKTITSDKYSDILEGIKALGLNQVSLSKVQSAVEELFPKGIESIAEAEVIKQVFCLIHKQNSTDNVNG
jgi:ACT domain-containing protein